MDVSAIDLGESLIASFAVERLSRAEVDSNVSDCAVEHWVDLFAPEAGESLAEPSRFLVKNVASL